MKLPDKLILKFTKDIIIVRCEPNWGGTFGYTSKPSLNCRVCGFKTEMAARRSAFSDVVADNPIGKAFMKEFVRLYNRNEKHKLANKRNRKANT